MLCSWFVRPFQRSLLSLRRRLPRRPIPIDYIATRSHSDAKARLRLRFPSMNSF